MKVLIIGLNYAPEQIGIAVYTTGLAEGLANRGHEVSVICGQPYYPAWKLMDGYKQSYSTAKEGNVDIIRCPHYVPQNPNGLKRIFHYITFAMSVFPVALIRAIRFRPDTVFTVAPSLVAAPVARLAALVVGAKSWLHVQDFEVEAAFATGLMDGNSRSARLARSFEKHVLKSFHKVSSISPQMCRKLASKGVANDRIEEFRNWADIETIHPLDGPSPYRKKWNITTKHVALYSGNIANKQGIEIVVEAAKRLQHRQDITFVICGEGPNRKALEKQGADLENIQFHDLQPTENLNDLMGLATIHLLPQLASAADLVLPSKLANMLASGRPVVATAAPGTGLAMEVEGCGIVTEPGEVGAFGEAIECLIDTPEIYAQTAEKARIQAENRGSFSAILTEFEVRIIKLQNCSRSMSKSH